MPMLPADISRIPPARISQVEMLPLSSFPMFGAPQNVFDRKLRKHMWLTTKPHATGTVKNYEPEPQPYLTLTLTIALSPTLTLQP